jgi:glutamate formiminotransferase/formiminotetrahydrofolate cyclodeaminase
MEQLVECVPNFSNGRNPEIYHAIADTIRSVPGIRILDISADSDHNRTVITFVGAPADVEEAAFRAIAQAADTIDLTTHSGEHPRIGATDVCPFIPISGLTIKDCVALAHRVGQRVGSELGLAVYLYGEAATRPEREKLSDIRKGQYELWAKEIGHNPARQPDYGPAEPKTCGPTVIGVRPFLVAYNLYLNSDSAVIAEKVARAVRFSNGGLRNVQARGFLVDGQAQVSMNLTNYEKTAVYQAQEMVKREAEQFGLRVTRAELVGLIPEKALLDSAKWYLQLHDLHDDQVLELRLREEERANPTPNAFLATVAANSPTPGGGSVAALAGALGAALTQMVAGLTHGRKTYAHVDAEAAAILAQAGELRQKLTLAITEDAAAYGALMAAIRQKEMAAEARQHLVEQATLHAAEVPLQVAYLSADVARLAETIAAIGNKNAVTDATAAVIMAHAAVQIAALNVRINAVGLADQTQPVAWLGELERLEAETAVRVQQVRQTAAERGGY